MNTEGLKKLQDMFPLVDGDVVAIIFGECDEDGKSAIVSTCVGVWGGGKVRMCQLLP